MSILVNKNTKVITQGITGKTGQFHTRACRDYANGKNCFEIGRASCRERVSPSV
jgi:succinyl-CoA synthetase alpha subunit